MNRKLDYEVIIIGGSYAGLSAAMSLGRSLRKVLIIDSGQPCNRFTPHSHNFLTQDGKTPAEITSKARQEVEQYETIHFHKGTAIAGKQTESGFQIVTETNKAITAKKLIFATGVKDQFPDIKGFSSCWGNTIVHCPYCHGYELRGKITAILANGTKAFHLAGLVKNLTNQVYILTNGPADFEAKELESFQKQDISIIATPLTAIKSNKGLISEVIFEDHSSLPIEAVYATLPFEQHADIPTDLGCQLSEHGYIEVDNMQKTSVSGVFACGDNSNMMRSVANAVHTGNLAGAAANAELTFEQV